MTLQRRNNLHVTGEGALTMILAHGFGCDQTMWKLLVPHLSKRYRVLTYDLTGAGQSDLNAYDHGRHASLWGHATDLNEIIDEYATGPVILIGHSVSAMICALATVQLPDRVAALVMIGGSPCYQNSGDYNGGFSLGDVQSMLATIDDNYLGWAGTMAPVLMGAPGKPGLQEELLENFSRTNAHIARHFARVIFLSDHRQDIVGLSVPTLILQCPGDVVVPMEVGEYLHRVLPESQLSIIDNIGHYPQLSAPDACYAAMEAFFVQRGLGNE
ncbi:alpha/beta hydrolase [Pseudomonas xanthosomatis]|uniref:alpha/beta fold hydrolase n=1 Tax=Pseudomonas xanthosomatis TaxID=2842356 RepID=UPI001C3C612F|nr:alpha/beta hydrolase [Pseudomonas xanthosomatis]QXH48932.1 alpha/beta hydrolase [Pseudomonas xanthosomatis]